MRPMANWTPLGQRSTRWLNTAASALAIGLALLLAGIYFTLGGPLWVNALGFGFTVSGVVLSVAIFTWTAQTAARRVQGPSTESLLYSLASTSLKAVTPEKDHLEAIAKRRGLGEAPEAVADLIVGVWKPSGAGRAPSAYLLEGPDLWFVNSMNARHSPDAGLRVERTPTGGVWKTWPGARPETSSSRTS